MAEEIDGNSINSAIATAGYTIAACALFIIVIMEKYDTKNYQTGLGMVKNTN